MPDIAPGDTADLTIDREVLIEAPVEVVWRTITEPDQIVQWFADRVELDLQSGGAGALIFEHHQGSTGEALIAPLVVATADPPRLFSFRWGHPEGEIPEAGNSVLVEFTLWAESGDRTRLRVVETGLEALNWAGDEKARYAEDHRQGWARHLGRLDTLFAAPAG